MDNFIPRQYKCEQITIRIETEQLEEIDKIAARFNLSRSQFINQCITYALSKLEIVKDSSA